MLLIVQLFLLEILILVFTFVIAFYRPNLSMNTSVYRNTINDIYDYINSKELRTSIHVHGYNIIDCTCTKPGITFGHVHVAIKTVYY